MIGKKNPGNEKSYVLIKPKFPWVYPREDPMQREKHVCDERRIEERGRTKGEKGKRTEEAACIFDLYGDLSWSKTTAVLRLLGLWMNFGSY